MLQRIVYGILLLLLAHSSFAECSGLNAAFTADQSFFCGTGSNNVNLTNTTTGTISPATSFDWYLDGVQFDHTTNIGTSVTTPVNSVGTHTIMLIVTDPTEPCIDTAIVSVDVVPLPLANFNFGPNNGCAFQDVNFTNTSSGIFSGTSYSWNFGDGNTSSQQNPVHQFNGPGTYNVVLTMTNGPGCTSTFNQSVTVVDAPIPSIGADDGDGNTVYCLFPGDNTTSETVTFSNFTTGAVSYDWDFGDGSPVYTTGSLTDFTHTYSNYGTFNVTMTATGPNGCQTSTTIQIIFEKFVSAALTLDVTEYSGCAPHELSSLTNLSVNATNFVWNFGDGSTFTTNNPTPPAYSYTTAGSYTITLTASNSCNTATATISPIIIIDGPAANFNQSISSGCAPQNVSFTNASSNAQPANNYQWNMGNGNTYTNIANPPVQTYPNSGTYTIQLIAGNACGNDTIIHTVFVDTIPTVDLVLDPITGCSPLNVAPTATLLSGTNVNWQWYVDGSYYSNAPNDIANQNFVSLNPNDSTLHTIQVNVSNGCGSDFDRDSVYVNPPVIAIFSTQDTICIGNISSFSNASTGTGLTYSWDFGDGSPVDNSTSPSHTYTSSGDYTVTLTVNGICGTDIYVLPVVVLDYPVIDITPSSTALCEGATLTFTNNSTTEGSYSWVFTPNGTPSGSTAFDPGIISFTGTGTHLASFTINHSGCISSDTVQININEIPVPQIAVTPTSGCTPLITSITNNTTDSPGYTYNWNYGNGSTSIGYIPVDQTYLSGLSDSSYTIQLIVESGSGCLDSIEQIVTVYPLPIADFTILDDTICLNQTMLFANNSTGASTYLWSFGDGSTSTAISPSHTYSTAGDFTVQLVAYSGNACTDTVSMGIYIDSIPQPAFTNTTECLGGTTIFTDNSTGSPVLYEWDFGDGSPIDNSINPTHTYSSAGSFLVQLTLTNSVNCSNSLPQIVQVNQVPIADFNWSQTCEGDAMNFTDATANSPITWDWDFGDGNASVSQNPNHIYADTGSYTVKLVVSGGSGCLDSITYNVYVDSIPTADFAFVQVCTGDTTIFNDLSTISPNNYQWNFGDGGTSTLINPTHVYTSTGNYNVSLTVEYSSNGCTNTMSQSVEAYPRTTPAFTANTPCLGDSTTLADATGGTPVSWEWDLGDGSPIETVQSPTHLYNSQGIFDITLITANAFGCSDTLHQQVEIFGLPTADFSSTAVCEGANTQFTDNSTDDVSWHWDFGDGGTDLNENPIHVYSGFGSYTVELIVYNIHGCSDTTDQSVTVYPNPTSAFTADTACFGYLTSFNDNSTDAIDWVYNFGDGANDNQQNPTHIYPSDGIYNVQQTVTNSYGCKDSTYLDVLINPQPVAGFTNNTVCAQDVVQFNDTTIGNITYWEWNFGDGSPVSNDQNPFHIYDPGGLYDVTLISGNTSGCQDTTVVSIEVFTNPVANFEADTVCYLDITHFTDLSTDVVPIVTWDWDFGDNINVSNLQNPTYIYQSAGTYPVVLTVTNIHGCDSTISIDVIVNNIPTAEFSYDTVCWGSPTSFNDISLGTVNSWEWDFGDGTTSTNGPTESHIYPNPGSYLASMEVDGGVGCTDIVFHAITVLDVLTPVIGGPSSACLNDLIQFTDQSVTTTGTITGWNWSFGDGTTSSLQNPTHAYSTSGTYTVTLDVQTSDGCTNTGTFDLVIYDPPVADFSFTIPCEGQPTIFTDNSSDPNGTVTNWQWNFGDGSPTDFTQSPQHLYAVAGNYNVSLNITSSNGCSASGTQTVTIYPSPTADFNYGLECGGVPIDMVSTSTGNIQNYEWIYSGNTISTTQNTTYTFPTDTDTHPVTLVVTTDLGCVDTIVKDVITKPVVFFDYGPMQTSGCPVMEVNFFENSTTSNGNATVINWLWDMGDSTYSFAQNPTHYYEDPGTYSITLTVTTSQDCIYTDTLDYTVIVFPQPTAGFTYAPDSINIMYPIVEFTDQSSGATDIEWYFGDYDYSNNWNPIHEYADTGYYVVTQYVYNEFGCPDTAYTTVHIFGNHFIYVPNAFTPDDNGRNELFNIKAYGIETYELLIFNRWGELIRTVRESDLGWDGTYLGEKCANDVYVWKLIAYDYDGINHELNGHVTLIR